MTSTSSSLPAAPGAAMDPDGCALWGAYQGTLAHTCVAPAVPWSRRWWAYKSWRWVGVFDPDVLATCAIFQSTYVGVVFATILDRRTATWYETEVRRPLSWGIQAWGAPERGAHTYSSQTGNLSISHDAAGLTVCGRLDAPGGPIRFDWAAPRTSSDPVPLTRIAPQPDGGTHVTQKVAGLPAIGVVEIGGRSFPLDPGRSLALVDWSGGYPPWETRWRWAMAGGTDTAGRPVGFNVCSGFNDSGATENGLWIGGVLHSLPPVAITPADDSPGSTWTVRSDSADGRLALDFHPEGMRSADENFGLVASRYRQALGHFTGWIELPDTGRVDLAKARGVAEDHLARW